MDMNLKDRFLDLWMKVFLLLSHGDVYKKGLDERFAR